jgi:hypothetical protein
MHRDLPVYEPIAPHGSRHRHFAARWWRSPRLASADRECPPLGAAMSIDRIAELTAGSTDPIDYEAARVEAAFRFPQFHSRQRGRQKRRALGPTPKTATTAKAAQ